MMRANSVMGAFVGVLCALGDSAAIPVDTCTDTIACYHTHGSTIGGVVWITSYSRVGKCGCVEQLCQETLSCRAWGTAKVPLPSGKHCFEADSVNCYCDDDFDTYAEIPLAASGCGHSQTSVLFACNGATGPWGCWGCEATAYGAVTMSCLSDQCPGRVCPVPPG